MADDKKPGLTVTVVGTGRGAMEVLAALSGKAFLDLPKSDPSKDSIAKAPRVTGEFGRAWRVDQNKLWALNPGGQRDGQVASWVVEVPWAHPVWHSYWVALVHLRPFRGMRGGTMIYLEGATHEVWVYALNPDTPRMPFVEGEAGPAYMTPKNFASQLVCAHDAEAEGRVEEFVRLIVDGKVNPDTDGSATMVAVLGDNMMKGRPGGDGPIRTEQGPH